MRLHSLCATALLAAISLAASGCSSSPEEKAKKRLVGKWEAKAEMKMGGQSGGPMMTMDFEFNDDGTMKMKPFGIDVSGTWEIKKVDGDKVTITATMNMPSGSGGKSESTEVTTKEDTKEFIAEFKSDDEFTLIATDDPGDPLTLKRKK